MKTYIITWQETHYYETEAENEEQAVKEALDTDGNETIINLYGQTITTKEE